MNNGLPEIDGSNKTHDYIDIRAQQRQGRKALTTIAGIGTNFNKTLILKDLRKKLACNGNIVNDEDSGPVIQLQGDHRVAIKEFLIKENISVPEKIKIHG